MDFTNNTNRKEHYTGSVIPLMEAEYEKFTVTERAIADFFIQNQENMDFSSKCMASVIHVSEAALSRFAKKLGFRGYREFIFQYQPSIELNRPQMKEQSIRVLHAYQELLNKTYTLIDEKQLERTVHLLLSKKRIFIYGLGSSGLAAQEFRLRLLQLGMDAEAITEFHQMIINEVRISEECLVIGISLSGATIEVKDAMVNAKSRGAAAVFITSRREDDWQSRIDEVLLTAVKKNLEYGNVISPQFPVLIVLDLLYTGCLRSGLRSKEEIEDVRLWERIKKYHMK